MKQTLPPLLLTLCLGAICTYCAAAFLAAIGAPPLALAFTERATIAFRNTGRSEIAIDAGGLESFLFHPAGGGKKYLLQIRSKPFAPGGEANARRLRAMKTLAPGESVELLDIRPHIAAMPYATGGGLSLTAVYFPPPEQGGGRLWTGEIKSLPLTVTE